MFYLILLLIGCKDNKPRENPIWEEVKIGDLALHVSPSYFTNFCS